MASVHQRQSKTQLDNQRRLLAASRERYYGKKDLARTYEERGLEVPRALRDTVRKSRVMLENKGAL